jgi:hypothetical protein
LDRVSAGAIVSQERVLWRLSGLQSSAAGNDVIARTIEAGTPASIGKVGAAELAGLRHFRRRAGSDGECTDWGKAGAMLYINAGVYPPDPRFFSRFCREYMRALGEVDLLGAWFQRGEWEMARRRAGIRHAAEQRAIEPYYHAAPWSSALAGKRVLVISPFAASIERQFAQRRALWPNRDVLPDFHLKTIRAPFSAGIAPPAYPDWFTALEALRERMSASQFDVALIGAGAWSLPLTAHAKYLGSVGIHMGGATQILFGIKGARWDSHPVIAGFYNDSWVRPGEDERPEELTAVEGGCYW